MEDNKRLLILGAGEMQVPIIEAANALGLYTITADMAADAPGMELGAEALVVSTMDKDALYEYCVNHHVDGVLTTSDAPVNVVAYLSKCFGWSSMSEDAAAICTNKYLQRECLAQHGVKTPFYRLVQNESQADDLTAYPYIVKPIDSSASRGVKRVTNKDEMRNAIIEALACSRSGNVIVEGYIIGDEFSVETLTQGGITHVVNITEKQTIGNDVYFVEDTHIEPARISADAWNLIETEVLKAIKAIGMDNCPGHTEVKLNENGAFIIETACRLGGDYITSDLVPLSTGVNMLENLVRLSLGETINVERIYNKVSAVQFLNTANYKRCTEFIVSNNKAIKRAIIHPYCDAQIRSSLDRLGYIILQTNTIQEMNVLLDQIK